MVTSWPDDFAWGVATSALQSEGAAPASDWATWEAAGLAAASGDGNGFRSRYADDFRLLAGHGVTHHRLVVEWARIEPADGKVDDGELDHIREVLRAGRDAGLAMWVCLHHVTLPRWFTDDLRGFRDEKTGRYRWAAHVDRCAAAFGDLVGGWQPMEAPARYSLEAFLFGRIPPGRTDSIELPAVLQTVQRASVDAARLLRGGAGPVVSSDWVAPLRPALDAADEVVWASWSAPELLDAFDLIGVTANPAVTVIEGHDPDGPPFFLAADPEPSPAAAAEGIGEVVDRVSELAPDMPIVLRATELAVDDDERRVEHLRAVLDAVGTALDAGADIRGYFHWSAVDGYELDGGFATRRGLFDRDRNARPTAELFAARAQRPR